MTTEPPTLVSARLRLRPHRLDDFESIVQQWSDPAVVAHFGGRPFSREDSWNRLLRYAGHWQLLGFGIWAVTRADGDRHIGDVGFLDGQRTGVPALGGPEAAWSFQSAVHGQGLAGEAVACALAWGEQRFARITAMINPANAPSIALARRAGFSLYGSAFYKAAPVGLWQRVRTAP
ncbi:GNAT family N-acetyltransferase [Sandarakinorhabdus sp.]|uniref:GNAT family N-acetyltransferase n=1 Tax=Sandarakinorhabdus sp. TaxID=1916663 RepID=UPI00286E49CF|nr:GNAT family N-acetyltransferase [Sandarakinorhabdus sp.]